MADTRPYNTNPTLQLKHYIGAWRWENNNIKILKERMVKDE